MNIKIKKLSLNEIDKIKELEYETYLYHKKLDPFWPKQNKNWWKELSKAIKTNLKKRKAIIYVALDGDKIIGFVYAIIRAIKLPWLKKEKFGWLEDVYVKKEYRKSRIGRQLTNKAYAYFKSKRIRYVELYVLSNNKAGLDFWNKLDYKEVDKRMRVKI